MTADTKPIVILGAGLQGSCIALELARSGQKVTLIDQDAEPMNRASLRNEGKIHLGLIYANDKTRSTGQLQLEGALQFGDLMSRWLGRTADDLILSTPFQYMVGVDSVLSPDELEEHYQALEKFYKEKIEADPTCNYLGNRPERLYRRMDQSEIDQHFAPGFFQAGFQTAEVSVDPAQISSLMRDALNESEHVEFVGGCRVESIERTGTDFKIEGTGPDGVFVIGAGQVVNCTWENRMALDMSLGIEPEPGWVHRLKYRVLAHIPEALCALPSVTMVLGAYGDVVVRPNSTVYLSWYPAGLQGWSHDLSPPPEWDRPCHGEMTSKEAHAIRDEIVSEICRWYPAMSQVETALIDAGVIVARGLTDVHDRESQLHDRTHVGVFSSDGYHSVDPGKLTTAPYFAMQAAGEVLGAHAAAGN